MADADTGAGDAYVPISIPQEAEGLVEVVLSIPEDRDSGGGFRVGAFVRVRAVPAVGFYLSGWTVSGELGYSPVGDGADVSGVPLEIAFTVPDVGGDAGLSVEAAFAEAFYLVCFSCESVGPDGEVVAGPSVGTESAGGAVVSADGSYAPSGGETAGSWCAESREPGVSADFTAVAADWYDFVGWYAGDLAGGGPMDLVSTETALTAAFPEAPEDVLPGPSFSVRFRERSRSPFAAVVNAYAPPAWEDRVLLGGKASVRLEPADGSPAVPDGPSYQPTVYSHVSPPEGALVFEAYPDERHVFVAWTDLLTGWSSRDRRVRLSPDSPWPEPLSLVFRPRPCRVRVRAAGSGTATAEAAGGVPSDSAECRLGDLVTLRAAPAAGASFVRWADGGEGADLAEREVPADGDACFTAVFSDAPRVPVRPAARGPGTVRGGRDADCGEGVETTPLPDAGAVFIGWTDGRADSPRTFRADGLPLPSAVFAATPRRRTPSLTRAMLAC